MTKIKILLLAGVTAIAGLAGFAYASDTITLNSGLQSAVEEGILDQQTAEKLQTYNREQRQQKMQETREERISNAIEEGRMSEDEANQIRDWQSQRPEAISKMGGFGKMRGNGGGNGMGFGGNCPMTD